MRYAFDPSIDSDSSGYPNFPDFLLLTPSAQDTSSTDLDENDLYALSRKTTTTGRPSYWGIVPIVDAPSSIPGVKSDDDDPDLTIAYIHTWVSYSRPEAAGNGEGDLALVIAGHPVKP